MSEPKPVISDEEIGTAFHHRLPTSSDEVIASARRLLAEFAERVAKEFEADCPQDDACDPPELGGCRYANRLREAAKGADNG